VLSSSLGIAWLGHLLPALDGWPELISLPPSCCLGVRWVSSDIISYCLSYIDGPSIERAFSREYWTIFLSAVPRWGSERVGSVCICVMYLLSNPLVTERRGRVVSIAASYSGGPGSRSLPGDRLSWFSVYSFPQSFQANAGIVR
jgi:hypothetical protein